MSVHKIKKPDSPFEIIPRATLQDRNLDCFELGALTRLCSLPADWHFNALWVEQLLGVGKDKRQALLSKLGQLGYYRCSKRHAQDDDILGGPSLKIRPGQWVYEHEFSAHGNLGPDRGSNEEPSPKADPARAGISGSGENEDNRGENFGSEEDSNEPDFPGALFPGAGSASAGKDGAIHITNGERKDIVRDEIPPPPANAVGSEVVVELIIPASLDPALHEKIRELLAGKKNSQAILDELGAGLTRPDPSFKIRDPIAWLRNVLRSGFRRTPAGLAIEKARRRNPQGSAGAAPTSTNPTETDAFLDAQRKIKKKAPPPGWREF